MVDVRETGQAETTVGRELTKDQGEGDGIGAAGEGDQQTGARRTEIVPPNRAPDLLEECDQKSQFQIPNPKPQTTPLVGIWILGFGIWDFVVPEGGLEPPTPRL